MVSVGELAQVCKLCEESSPLIAGWLGLCAGCIRERPDPPPLVVSTLLVPGYVDAAEVGRIAHLIADQSPDVPYVLLGFAPHFLFPDLPPTSVRHAEEAEAAAREAGLTPVRVGNRHLLSRAY